jgi:hypothetical protein
MSCLEPKIRKIENEVNLMTQRPGVFEQQSRPVGARHLDEFRRANIQGLIVEAHANLVRQSRGSMVCFISHRCSDYRLKHGLIWLLNLSALQAYEPEPPVSTAIQSRII